MCATLFGGILNGRLLLDLRQFHDLLEAAAIAVGNLNVTARALHDLARDGEA